MIKFWAKLPRRVMHQLALLQYADVILSIDEQVLRAPKDLRSSAVGRMKYDNSDATCK